MEGEGREGLEQTFKSHTSQYLTQHIHLIYWISGWDLSECCNQVSLPLLKQNNACLCKYLQTVRLTPCARHHERHQR